MRPKSFRHGPGGIIALLGCIATRTQAKEDAMTESAVTLAARSCRACEGKVAALGNDQIASYLAQLPGWARQANEIVKTFKFKNYYETMAFVNATAWVSHREDHHP